MKTPAALLSGVELGEHFAVTKQTVATWKRLGCPCIVGDNGRPMYTIAAAHRWLVLYALDGPKPHRYDWHDRYRRDRVAIRIKRELRALTAA